jgi:triacylglycerol esterase/lipase EstA (alpha/beta hydrolase family)
MRAKLLGGTLSVFVAALIVVGCSKSGGGAGMSAAGSSAPAATASSNSPAPPPPAPPLPVYGTRKCWPIVFVHGMSGFKNIGPVNYWMDIPDILTAAGFETFVVQDKPFATAAERAAEAKAQIVAKYPDPRVKINLIAHSMGGLDIRYMITNLGMGDRVATAMTMGTPHHGSSVADMVVGLVPGPMFDAVNLVFKLIGWDVKSATQELTTVYCDQVFNPSTPDDPRVKYFSWVGAADPTASQPNRSLLEPAFLVTWSIVNNLEGENDGLVSTTSAQWGQFMGTFPADHLNEVGQPFGLIPTAFDYRAFYTKWADDLEAGGFGPP